MSSLGAGASWLGMENNEERALLKRGFFWVSSWAKRSKNASYKGILPVCILAFPDVQKISVVGSDFGNICVFSPPQKQLNTTQSFKFIRLHSSSESVLISAA